MKYRVAVIGGGPSCACAAEICAQEPNIETYIIERKMDNAKPCGGAIPLCMVDEFDLPSEIIDRKVRKMKMISPSNVEVDIGSTLKDDEYIGMCRREVMDGYLRGRVVFDIEVARVAEVARLRCVNTAWVMLGHT